METNNNLGALLPINENNGQRAVNARDLHSFLESKQQFADWMKNRIDQFGFVEGQDYQVFMYDYQGNLLHKNMKSDNQYISKVDYALSIDMAKELSMVERNEKGKQARRYFIACEDKLKKIAKAPTSTYQVPQSFSDALMLAAQQQKQIEQQAKQLEAKTKEIESKDKQISVLEEQTEYTRSILNSPSTVLVTQIAQDYGYAAKKFNAILRDLKVQRKVGNQWILYAKYLKEGYVQSQTHEFTHKDGRDDVALTTKWTQKGRLFLYSLLKKNGYFPLIEQQTLI